MLVETVVSETHGLEKKIQCRHGRKDTPSGNPLSPSSLSHRDRRMPYDEEAEQRADLVRVLDDAPAHVLKVVAALLRSVGESPERGDGTDLGAVSRELVAALLWAATGTLLLPDETGQRMRRYEYTRHLSVGFLNAVEWIRHRRSGTLTPQLSQRIIQCRLRGWPMHGVVYVRPTQHYGRSVGLGVFAMVHLRQQLLFQFAGRVVTGGRCYLAKRAARQDYCIEFNYGLDAYTVNPLDADDVAAHADNVAAFINEPSAPPWQPGDETSVGGRRARAVVRLPQRGLRGRP